MNHILPALFYTPINVYIDLFSSTQQSWYCLAYHRVVQTGFHTTQMLLLISQ